MKTCLPSFNLFSITNIKGSLNVDGVLGLAPSPPEDIIGGKTFIDSLFDAKIIN
jgi:hypothetical protein